MGWLERVLERMSVGLVYIATLAVLTLTGFVCLSAVMRYVVGSPFHFTEELVALLFLSMVFLTLPYATVLKQHIRVTLFTGRLTGGWARAASLFNLAIILTFATWFTAESYEFARFAHEIGAISEQSSFTLWPWMALIPLAMGLVAAIVALQFAQSMTAKHTEDGED